MNADRWYIAVLATFGNVGFYGREEGDKVLVRKLTHIVFNQDGKLGLKKWNMMDLQTVWLSENALDINRSAIVGMRPATEAAAKDFDRAWADKPNIILANGSDVKKAEDDAKRFKLM